MNISVQTGIQFLKDMRQKNFTIPDVSDRFTRRKKLVLHHGEALNFLKSLPASFVSLVVTSPPYNVGKEYESKQALHSYLDQQAVVIDELVRVLKDNGSICWQVGNFVRDGEVFPLDVFFYQKFKERGLFLRNRIFWHFGHGLHASRRFSGRYETILWFSKNAKYVFNLDAVRIPSKYPGKTYYKGPKKGQPSSNMLGKNPSDVWKLMRQEWKDGVWEIPNVKAHHPEKTDHPCQFPIELVERCVLALTNKGDWVLDPYSGTGSSLIAAAKHGRKTIGCEKEKPYVALATRRLKQLAAGKLKMRILGTPVFQPTGREKVARPPDARHQNNGQKRPRSK